MASSVLLLHISLDCGVRVVVVVVLLLVVISVVDGNICAVVDFIDVLVNSLDPVFWSIIMLRIENKVLYILNKYVTIFI